jgi:hypothetical protein
MPLTALTAQFPTDPSLTSLAYAEAVSAIDHLVRVDGQDALLKLVDAYATGPTDDEAFMAATGLDVAGFQARWLAELGADAPAERGPQPNPAGPVPPGWAGSAPLASSTPTPSSGAAPGSDGQASGGTDPTTVALVLAGVGLVVVLVIVGLVVARRRTPAA